MPTSWHRIRGQGGFTIVELIAVIVVFAILVITAQVRTSISDVDLDAVAKSLRSNLQFAQDLAMTHGSTYGFHRRTATEYEIYEGAPGTPALNPLDGTTFVIDISPVQFTGTTPDIPFFKSGKPDIAADATISLIDTSGARILTVVQDTGFVSMGP